MLVGEQPGDQEDIAGKPFAGPAGELLDDALAAAGIDRRQVYITNAVKHFKFEMRGKRRMHKTPAQKEVAACHYWLEAELESVAPDVIVALGATALKSILQSGSVALKDYMGEAVERNGRWLIATYHPAYALRVPSSEARAAARRPSLTRCWKPSVYSKALLGWSLLDIVAIMTNIFSPPHPRPGRRLWYIALLVLAVVPALGWYASMERPYANTAARFYAERMAKHVGAYIINHRRLPATLTEAGANEAPPAGVRSIAFNPQTAQIEVSLDEQTSAGPAFYLAPSWSSDGYVNWRCLRGSHPLERLAPGCDKTATTPFKI